MREVFVDACYWVAVARPDDPWGPSAEEARRELGRVRLTTTEEVLVEFLNFFSSAGARLRLRATRAVAATLEDKSVRVLRQSHASFSRGLDFYAARSDKGYSLTDCVSMCAMRARGVDAILTNDRHFAQEGFTVLMRRGSA